MNPIEWTFNSWAINNTSHPLDRKKFYEFINTVYRYYKTDGRKWKNKLYFLKQCRKYNINEEEAIKKYELFNDIMDYKLLKPSSMSKISRNIFDGKKEVTYIQSGFYDGEYPEIKITEDEFNKRKIGKKVFKNRVKINMIKQYKS